jgi:hypothetical protein
MPVLLLLLILVAGVVGGLLLDPERRCWPPWWSGWVVLAPAFWLLDLGPGDYQEVSFWLSWLALLVLALALTRLGAWLGRRRRPAD